MAEYVNGFDKFGNMPVYTDDRGSTSESGSEGGSGDFNICTLNLTGSTGSISITYPVLIEEDGMADIVSATNELQTGESFNIVVPKNGGSVGTISSQVDFDMTGGIQHMDSNLFRITGDCTITLNSTPIG